MLTPDWILQATPMMASLTMQTVILWMKLISYAHCNSDFRCHLAEHATSWHHTNAPTLPMFVPWRASDCFILTRTVELSHSIEASYF